MLSCELKCLSSSPGKGAVVKSLDLLHMEVKGHVITSMGLGVPGEY